MILTLQILIGLLSVVAAGVVLAVPGLDKYALQFFALFMVGFVLTNRSTRKKVLDYKVLTEQRSLHLAWQLFFGGAAIILLVGATGGFASWMLPLLFVYIFFLSLTNGWLVTLVNLLAILALLYYQTADFGPSNYGAALSLIVFWPVAWFAQKYFARFLREQAELKLEREKIIYYNLYAEKQQGELLKRGRNVTSGAVKNSDLTSFIEVLIPQIDDVQRESRFPENQLVVSAKLTKIGLALRQILKNTGESEKKKIEK